MQAIAHIRPLIDGDIGAEVTKEWGAIPEGLRFKWVSNLLRLGGHRDAGIHAERGLVDYLTHETRLTNEDAESESSGLLGTRMCRRLFRAALLDKYHVHPAWAR